MDERILLLSWGAPPLASGSAVIVGNLAREFTTDEMILATERPYGQREVVWPTGKARLAYVAEGWPPTWRGARWWRRVQFPLTLLRSLYLARRNHCTSVVAVFPNEEFLLIGYFTALFSGAPFFPYFHNTWLENRKGLARLLARYLQPRVFARARHVFLMSEGMVELYRERYPHVSCSALVHSFNGQLPVDFPAEVGSTLRLAISGNIYEVCRDATVRVCEAIFRSNKTELIFLTGTPRSELAELGLLREGVGYDTVASSEVVDRLREADIVVLPHGFTGSLSVEEYRTIFPTRTIEYLISGRPILAHAPADCYLTRFLKKHECALVVDTPSVGELLKAIERLRSDPALREKLVLNALKASERFCAPRVVATFRARLKGDQDGTLC